jgi:ATP-binding cassette subfamily C protein EexD
MWGTRNARPLMAALWPCRDAFVAAAAFSFFINLLMLASPLYMMQIYNRVLPSRSESTLIVLTGLVAAMLAVMCLLELIRSRILVRVSGRLDVALSGAIMAAMARASLGPGRSGAQALRDFDTVRQFLSGAAIFTLFDAPWMPITIAVIFVLHPALGAIATLGAVALFGLGVLNEIATRQPLEAGNRQSVRFNVLIEGALRNAEVVEAMGMFGNLQQRWQRLRGEMLAEQATASDRAGSIMAASKFVRLILQTALLAAGAWLAVNDLIAPGVIIAASILVGRAVAPVEGAIGTWKQFVVVRTAHARLNELLARQPEPVFRTALPRPTGRLTVENLTFALPGGGAPILRQVDFELPPGQVLGIIGRSAAGKSTLARLIVGAWRPSAGKVRLDGADIAHWSRDELGPHVGYLPQDVELFDGTISENIARFGTLDSAKIVAAAQAAGVHDLVLRQPKGYDTPIGPGGSSLSGGQRQRIALARALYDQPVLVVLDEPNSNLDDEGDAALIRAVARLKEAGATVVLISHRPHVVELLDQVLILVDGAVRAFGPRHEVLSRLAARHVAPPPEALPDQRPAKVA